ncbi:hypothetical protein CQJ94_13580 [Glycomyces fuscus]|nr:hypothetical protein CQJ94_13580 [Glycomyces fuscus]
MSRSREEVPPARAWFGTSPSSEAPRPPVAPGGTREPRRVGPPRPADPVTVNPAGEEESPDPDAEETDVFLVLGADRRARKTREEGQETPEIPETPKAPDSPGVPEAPEVPKASESAEATDVPETWQEQGSPLHQGSSPSAPGTGEAASGGPEEDAVPSPEAPDPVRPDTDTVVVQAPPPAEADPEAAAFAGTVAQERDASHPGYGDRPLVPTGFADIPAAPYAGAEQPEPGRGVLRDEGRLDIPDPYSPAPEVPAPEPPARGIESWIDAVGDGHVPVRGGYEQRIAAVRRIPASPWRRAVFAVTGGRLNLG